MPLTLYSHNSFTTSTMCSQCCVTIRTKYSKTKKSKIDKLYSVWGSNPRSSPWKGDVLDQLDERNICWQRGIRTPELSRDQIYSLTVLTTHPPVNFVIRMGFEPMIFCLKGKRVNHFTNVSFVFGTGIEPVSFGWKPNVLPFDEPNICERGGTRTHIARRLQFYRLV